jgi:ATP-binding cassette, subfamily G (WHITE), member 2
MHVQGIQNRFGLLFFILLFLSLLSLSSLPIWKESMLLFYRERDAGAYTTSAFFIARVLFDIVPLRVVPPLLFLVHTYPQVGLHAGSVGCTLWFGVSLVLGNVASTLLCMFLGVALPSMPLANLVQPPFPLAFRKTHGCA